MNNHVGLDDKLAVLQASDAHRKWYSLDDRRVCILCEKLINGRMIDIWQDHDGTYRLHCPTPGCSGTTRDWFYCGFKAAHRPKIAQERRIDIQLEFLRQIDSQQPSTNIRKAGSVAARNENRAH
jgi:hypothetical protein